MTISTTDDLEPLSKARGTFADGLTFIRIAMAPVIAWVIFMAWSSTVTGSDQGVSGLRMDMVVLASFLFGIAALTDLLDDYIGGSARSSLRAFGWLDDIADSVLIIFTLAALLFVVNRAGGLSWTFAVPAVVIILRDLFVGITKGFELSTAGGRLESRLGDIKSFLAMLAILILVAAPWLSNLVADMYAPYVSNYEELSTNYGGPNPLVWYTGLAVLWGAMILSLISAYNVFTASTDATANVEEAE